MLSQTLIRWYQNEFKTSQLYADMENTTEGSPWHRERNVGVHTDMVVSHYINRCPYIWDKEHLMGFIVCAFHDVGKPSAEIWKHSEARGEYRAYHGHELTSSRMWEDFICSNIEFKEKFNLSNHDIYGITWMIEHHVPWSTKDERKRLNYAKTIIKILGKEKSSVFTDVLLSDTYGRISDDANAKINSAKEWVKSFNKLVNDTIIDEVVSNKCIHIPIGPSGCGKSTYFNTLDNVESYSLDTYREEWYPRDNYNESWEAACDDNQFMNKAHALFMSMIKSNKDVYADEMNLSKKRRNFVIMEARKKGYKIIGIVFPLSVNTLITQQTNRTDKIIGKGLYSNMYANVQQPSYGEFDEIKVMIK